MRVRLVTADGLESGIEIPCGPGQYPPLQLLRPFLSLEPRVSALKRMSEQRPKRERRYELIAYAEGFNGLHTYREVLQ
jgi:hypothetical protein